jgi:PAS domain S-box-containing protein
MNEQDKTKDEFFDELAEMQHRIDELEAALATFRQREGAGEEAEATTKAMIEAFDDFIYVCSTNYEVEFMNERFIQRTGRDPIGEKCYQAIHNRKEVCPWCVNERVQNGETVRWEVQSPKDSRWYHVVNTPVRHRDGTISKMAVIQDITQRKEAEEVLRKAKDELEAKVQARTSELESSGQRLEGEISVRKETAEALRESEERFRAIFESHHVVMLIVDPETGRIGDASPGASTFYGYSRGDLKKKNISEINVLSTDHVFENLQMAKSQDRRYFDFQHRLAGGEIRDVEVCSGPIAIGGRTLLFSVISDVTDRKRAAEAIRESEARVRVKLDSILSPEGDLGILELADVIDAQAVQALMDDFFSLTNIGVGIIDLKGKVLVATGWQEICTKFHRVHPETCNYCVESDTRLSGGIEQGSFKLYRCKNNMWDIATPIVVGGRHLGNLFLGQFLFEGESPDQEFFRSQARQYGFNEEEYLSALERVPRWSRETVDTAMAFYTKLAHILSTLSYSNVKLARSLAEQERLANSLRESEQRYKALFDESRDGVWWTARDGMLVEANQAFLDLFGLTKEESRHWNVIKGYRDPADRTRFRKTIETNGSVVDYEVKFKKKDGTEIECLLTATLRLDSEGKVLGYQGILRDVTDRKKLEQQLLQAQKMEAVGTLAGGIAHDFNNLLTVILGYSELIISEKDERDRDYEDLKKVIHAARTAGDMVQQILAFSRKTETKLWPINLNKQVPQLRKMLSRLLPRTIEVQIGLAPDLPTVNADPAQIDQILINLAVNARDAMPGGGRLTIETKAVVLDDEYCSAHIEASRGLHALITVSDTGTGIDRASSDRIFEPFYTTKKPGQGTGLGLAMVYGIVKGHGGHITVHSEPGAGTSFEIYLPAHQVETEPNVATSSQFGAFGDGTILLADDEELVRSLGQRILERTGYKILTAGNGREALEIYRQNKDEISLVILDLIMPVMDGKQCLDEILKINPQAKVLIASGYSPDGATKEILEGRVQGLVNKPYEIKQMVKSVREALDSK